MKAASADTASSLRDWVTAAFQTMNEVSEDFFSSRRQFWPILFLQIDLNAIGGSSDKLVDEPRANWTEPKQCNLPYIVTYIHAHSSPSVKSCIFYTPSMILNLGTVFQNMSCILLKTGIYSPKTRMEINLDPFETASDLLTSG